jgi:hypothetical protein
MNEFQQLLDDTSKDLYEIKDSVNQKLEVGSLKKPNTDLDEQN